MREHLFTKKNYVLNYLLIATALGSLTAGSFLRPVKGATDSSPACWNMDGIIDQNTGACILPQCSPGIVREPTILTGTKCNLIHEPQGNEKQLATALPPSSSPLQKNTSEG